MKQLDAPNTHRAKRVSVIGLAQPKESLLRRLASLLPALEGLLERDLHRGGAGVRVEDPSESGGRALHERSGEQDPRLVRQAQKRRVGNAVELLPERAVKPRM